MHDALDALHDVDGGVGRVLPADARAGAERRRLTIGHRGITPQRRG